MSAGERRLAAAGLGVFAFGDSITNGGGELQWGVALQSWALWVARALGLPFTSYAADGARAMDVVREQIPAWRSRTAHPDARYELGCLYIGVNDVRADDWDPSAFEHDFRTALGFLTERCDRTITLYLPLELGRPRATAKVAQANAAVERSSAAVGALTVDLRGFRGRRVLMADQVHPTALGQITIAERALDVLTADGLPAKVMPSALIDYETTRWTRLRGDLVYAYRHAKVGAKALAVRRLAALAPRSSGVESS